jgi:hypothetical protein
VPPVIFFIRNVLARDFSQFFVGTRGLKRLKRSSPTKGAGGPRRGLRLPHRAGPASPSPWNNPPSSIGRRHRGGEVVVIGEAGAGSRQPNTMPPRYGRCRKERPDVGPFQTLDKTVAALAHVVNAGPSQSSSSTAALRSP